MKAIRNTWNTLTETLRVLRHAGRDSFYPLLSYSIILLLTFAAVVPLLEGLLGSYYQDGLAWTGFFLVVYLAYGALYLVITFCNVAMVMGIAAQLDGDGPQLPTALLTRALRRLKLIGRYTVVAASLGVVSFLARTFINPLFGGIIMPRVGDTLWAHWHQLSYTIPLQLAVPVIALDRPAPERLFTRSEQLVKETWGERVKPAHSINLLALLVLLPIIILVATPTLRQGLAEHNSDLIWLGLSVLLIGIASYTQLSALANAIYALAAYRYATAGKSDVVPGDPSYAEYAFAKPKKETSSGAALTVSTSDSHSAIANDPSI